MTMTERPTPLRDADTTPFWNGVDQHTLLLQHCYSCSAVVFYPRLACPACGGMTLEWFEASGSGIVYSFTVVHRAAPGFEDAVPYAVALVDLAEGARMMTRIIDASPADLRVGAAVEVSFVSADGDVVLPYFRLARK